MARIAIGGFQHETNTFAPSLATLADFESGGAWPELTTGPALVDRMRGINLSIAGFIEEAERAGHRLLPTTWGAASPSSYVTEHAYEHIAGLILDGLRAAQPFDAVYLCLHGAMVTEHLQDGEGELLRRVRSLVGGGVPIVASLDFHSNTTPEMVGNADALVGYRTYPHIDMADTGRRTALHLYGLLGGSGAVHKAFRQLPFIIPITWQCTTSEPMQSIMEMRDELEGGVEATHGLHHDLHFRVRGHSEGILVKADGGIDFGGFGTPGRDMDDPQRSAGAAGDFIGVVPEQTQTAATHGAETTDSNLEG